MASRVNIEKVHLIPHFHFDFEWWKEEPYHEDDAVLIMEKAFSLMREFPSFTYVIDTILPLKRYLEKYPHGLEEIQSFIREGRLELVGGTIVSPDEHLPTTEGLIRQFYEGEKWYHELMGIHVSTAWEIDEFSHPAQLPQILALNNIRAVVFSRGVKPYYARHPVLFRWSDPAGIRTILAYWWAGHYSTCLPTKKTTLLNIIKFTRDMRARIEYEGRRSPVSTIMIPLGGDFTFPHEDWIAFVEHWNKHEKVKLEFSIPSRYFDIVEREELPIHRGGYGPVFNGVFSSRELLKQRSRYMENRIVAEEKKTSICSLQGMDFPDESFRDAWRLILKSDFHDTLCGTGTDRVYRKSLERYRNAEYILNAIRDKRRGFLSGIIGQKGWYAFNPLSWSREESIIIDGHRSLVRIPALGLHRLDEINREDTLHITQNSLENEFVKVHVDPATGSINIFDKTQKIFIFNRQENNLKVEDDVGNLWVTIPTGREYGLDLKELEVQRLKKFEAEISITLKNEFVTIDKKILLQAGRKRIDVMTGITFSGKDKRIDETFPFSFPGTWYIEEPAWVTEKSSGIFPVQNFVLYSEGDYNVGIINCGIPGHSLEDNTCRMILLRSVSIFSWAFFKWLGKNFRLIFKVAQKSLTAMFEGLKTFEYPLYPIHGVILRDWASEGTNTGFGTLDFKSHLKAHLTFYREAQSWERGEHFFRYAIVPGVKDVEEIIRLSLELNNPLTPFPLPGGGSGESLSLIKGDLDGIMIAAFHPHSGGYLLRCRDITGTTHEASIILNFPCMSIKRLDHLFSDAGEEIGAGSNTITYTFRPYELALFHIVFTPGGKKA
ncbi:MAG: hypothetical protein CVV44_18335 [Spirochaetae bacterium HGW-Spirochaetae-1]|jgi:alpha-mannosidase|nr:MAG: hypothetical protein CVV44_18335 [Spirochaetae bacterium HGW-Spirochaetae-1]